MRILETSLYAEDLVAARGFYVDLLGFREISFDPGRSLFLRAEDAVLIVFKASKTIIPDAGVPPHGTVGPGHVAFAASDEEIDSWKDRFQNPRFQNPRVEIIEEIVWGNGARSIYFRDPGDNVLEFATPRLWGL